MKTDKDAVWTVSTVSCLWKLIKSSIIVWDSTTIAEMTIKIPLTSARVLKKYTLSGKHILAVNLQPQLSRSLESFYGDELCIGMKTASKADENVTVGRQKHAELSSIGPRTSEKQTSQI